MCCFRIVNHSENMLAEFVLSWLVRVGNAVFHHYGAERSWSCLGRVSNYIYLLYLCCFGSVLTLETEKSSLCPAVHPHQCPQPLMAVQGLSLDSWQQHTWITWITCLAWANRLPQWAGGWKMCCVNTRVAGCLLSSIKGKTWSRAVT